MVDKLQEQLDNTAKRVYTGSVESEVCLSHAQETYHQQLNLHSAVSSLISGLVVLQHSAGHCWLSEPHNRYWWDCWIGMDLCGS